MSIKHSTINQTVRQLKKRKADLKFDLAIQRNEVWDLERKSLFIHSLIYGFPVPDIFAKDEGDNLLWFLDGKQRLTTALDFGTENFILHDNTPSITDEDGNEVEIAGLGYSQLPKELQAEFDSYSFRILVFKDLTDDETEEMFFRLNNGMPLKQIELTRVVAGSDIMGYIQSVAKKPFFANSIDLTKNARVRFTDEEVILQIFSLLYNNGNAVEFGGKDIREFASNLRDKGITDDVKTIINNVTDYLGQAFPVHDKILKKVHIPMIFMMALRALQENIPAIKFAGWVQSFFAKQKPASAYNNSARANSARKDNVGKRLKIMGEDYDKHIKDASDYVQPQPKQSGGRKKKNDTPDVVNVDQTSNQPDNDTPQPQDQPVGVVN